MNRLSSLRQAVHGLRNIPIPGWSKRGELLYSDGRLQSP